MPFADLPSARVAFRDVGSGPVVLLLHATLHDSSDYATVVDDLARDYRVVTLDWPGHGGSPRPAPPHSLGAGYFAKVLGEFVAALELTTVVVVGNSVGGYAGCRLALDDPDRVAALVLVQGSGFTPRGPAVRLYCAALASPWVVRHTFGLLVPRYLSATNEATRALTKTVVTRAQTASGSRVAAQVWRSFLDPRHDLRQRAGRISQPTLVIWGVRDKTLQPTFGRAIRKAIPGTQYVEMDTGHVPFLSDPDGWLAVVRPFIRDALAGSHETRSESAR